MDKEQKAFERLRLGAEMSKNYYNAPLIICYSGGKDSDVLVQLALNSGIEFEVLHNHTTADAPETFRHITKTFKRLEDKGIKCEREYPDIPAVFVDTGLEYPEIRDFVKTKENVVWLKPEMNFKQVIRTYGYPVISKTVAHNVSVAKRNPHGAVMRNLFNPNKRGPYAMFKWSYLLDAPFDVSEKCCDIMKKKPAHIYEKQSNRKPMLATMTEESTLRRDNWLKYGCNAFNAERPKSKPMSFWTEQDVLQYIHDFEIDIAPVYGAVKKDDKGKFHTTGCQRTGCVFCGFGCHLEKAPNRFQRLKQTHPQLYDYCIRSTEDNGLGLGAVLDFIGVNYK